MDDVPGAGMPVRVAVTGATGFIGRRLVTHLLDAGLEVRALARSRPLPEHDRLYVERGSLESRAALESLVRECDAVIHVAGAIRGRSQAAFDAVNVDGTSRLTAAVATVSPSAHVVLLSSLAARAPELSWYARSKRGGEKALITATRHWSVLRPPAVYGPDDPALAPLWRALAAGWLPRPGPAHGRFSLVHVDDVCEALLRLARRPPTRTLLTLHDGRRGGYGWQDIADIAAQSRGAPVRTVPIPRSALRLMASTTLAGSFLLGRDPVLTPGKVRELAHPDWVCDNDALIGALGWTPGIRLHQRLTTLPGWKT